MSGLGDGPMLIVGGAGFIGCNIADRLASVGRDVIVLDALARPGVETNLDWLRRRHGAKIRPVIADVRDAEAVALAVRDAAAVFHMAAQVAVTTSLVDPIEDFSINLVGTLNILESVRRFGGRAPMIFASTNKVYGDLGDVDLVLGDSAYRPADPELHRHGVGEDRPLDFHTPYGCSKGAADQYVLDYARSFGLRTAVLRMSCIYGPRQMGVEDQGWVAHFMISALRGQPISIYGDGLQVRDILHVSDAVDAYMAVLRDIDLVSGRAFNLGGGPTNAVSLRQVLAHIERLTQRRADLRFYDWRPGDQRYFVADARAVRTSLGLKPPIGWRDGLSDLADWLKDEVGVERTLQQFAEAAG